MTNETKEEKAVLTLIALILGVGLILLQPFAIMWMWNWFISPLFETFSLSYLTAFGLFLFLMVLPRYSPIKSNAEADPYKDISKFITKYITLGILLVVALIIKGLM